MQSPLMKTKRELKFLRSSGPKSILEDKAAKKIERGVFGSHHISLHFTKDNDLTTVEYRLSESQA
jgi:hypothetical protein